MNASRLRRARLLPVVAALSALLPALGAGAAHAAPTALDAFGAGELSTTATGVAVAPSGRVYVADPGSHSVRSFTPAGAPAGSFTGTGAGTARMNRPVGVAVDAAGDVYVTEANGDRLHRFSADGDPLASTGGHGRAPGLLDDPAGVAVAADGSILVVDAGNARIQAFAPTGALLASWGARGAQDGGFVDPYGIAVAPGGDILVTDRGARRVQRFTADGTFLDAFDGTGTAAGPLVDPTGVVVDREGTVHVADAGRDRILTFSAGGAAEAWGATPPLAGPAGLATDCRASVYVVDARNALVRRFGRAGAVAPPCTPPVAAFTATPATALLGAPVAFDASASGDDGRIVRMDWDLDGDGVFESVDRGPVVTHAFDRVGGVPVGLRVTDDDGEQDQATQGVSVLAPAAAARVEAAPAPAPIVRVIAASRSAGPVLGVSLLAERVSGTVRFRRPGAARSETLATPLLLPVGTRFDTTAGRVRLTLATDGGTATQQGEFWSGIFTAFQGTGGPLTELVLADAPSAGVRAPQRSKRNRSAPKRQGARARAAANRRRSRLWGKARGSFRTTGRNAAATIRGTQWLVEDGEAGTTVRVTTGVVSVRDRVAGTTVQVRAGERYLARDACASRRAFSIRLRVPVGVRVRSVAVRVNGRRVPVVLRRGRLMSRIDLRGRPEGRQVVRITLVSTTGARITGTRRYETCGPKREAGAAPRI